MNHESALSRFRTESISTAAPATLLTMLYDRLVLDLDRGAAALEAGDRTEANAQLLHAQAIIHELRASLVGGTWDGADGLSSLYGYLLTELVGANIARDARRVRTCRELVAPLRDAWHEAARTTGELPPRQGGTWVPSSLVSGATASSAGTVPGSPMSDGGGPRGVLGVG